jgi:hypothetical protein
MGVESNLKISYPAKRATALSLFQTTANSNIELEIEWNLGQIVVDEECV